MIVTARRTPQSDHFAVFTTSAVRRQYATLLAVTYDSPAERDAAQAAAEASASALSAGRPGLLYVVEHVRWIPRRRTRCTELVNGDVTRRLA